MIKIVNGLKRVLCENGAIAPFKGNQDRPKRFPESEIAMSRYCDGKITLTPYTAVKFDELTLVVTACFEDCCPYVNLRVRTPWGELTDISDTVLAVS